MPSSLTTSPKRDLFWEEVAFLWLEFEMGFSKPLENGLQMLQMLVYCLAENQYVIQIVEADPSL